jgi:hypothetical protein
MNNEQGIRNEEVEHPPLTFIIPCSLFIIALCPLCLCGINPKTKPRCYEDRGVNVTIMKKEKIWPAQPEQVFTEFWFFVQSGIG